MKIVIPTKTVPFIQLSLHRHFWRNKILLTAQVDSQEQLWVVDSLLRSRIVRKSHGKA